MGQLRETAAPSCCFLLFLLLFLVAPCHGQPQDVAWGALSPDDRAGDMYAAYPMEADLERGEDPRDLPVGRISGLHHFHRPQAYRGAVAPRIPSSRSQMDLGFEPEEYPRGAGGVRPAGSVDQKQGENHLAVGVLAILFSLVILAALGYLAKQLLMKRQAGAMLGETGIDMRNKDLPPLEKGQNVARITIGIEDLTGKSNPNLEGVLYSTFSGLAALFCQSSQQSSQPVFCRLSEITDDSCSDTSKKTPKSGEERSTCCCGRAVELGEPEKP
ncbi:uncharacterized protein LOC107055526 isoform X4 [Gallus gallus]|uniref:uncharacterized protein LOC107055526 isoform X4 n=2 Tax=Gallus gallus TaxID=9031 RepID=UPI001AEB68F3|nr:uncharacterized protein LOC107055526 isoform X4 [Gallus gallus]XP_046765743.1 uncharacterized protein LOC107055526 isoform X4 [Gallus gallus]